MLTLLDALAWGALLPGAALAIELATPTARAKRRKARAVARARRQVGRELVAADRALVRAWGG